VQRRHQEPLLPGGLRQRRERRGPRGACVDDADAPNDVRAASTVMGSPLSLAFHNLVLCPRDLDWYEYIVPAGAPALVDVCVFASSTTELLAELHEARAARLVC
jgi:hypothetical protein